MEWLNLHSSVLDSPEFVGEEPVNQATWLKLQRFCIGQENGGRIEGCREWKDRKWQQLVRVTKREAETDSELWEWDGDDLVVLFYPIEKESEVRTKREVARENGAKGGRPRKKPVPEPTENQNGNPTKTDVGFSSEPKGANSEKAEGKGKEGNGKESESACARDAHRIVSAYPRREKTAEALSIVERSLADGDDAGEMLAGTKACAEVIRSLPSGHLNRYVPSAVAFFRDRRWADDPETLRRQGNTSTGQGTLDLEEAKRQLGGRAAYLED